METIKDPKFKDFTTGDLHIILYAKGWYVTKNTMADLRTMMSKLFLLPNDVSSIPDKDIVGLVADTMHKVLSMNNQS